MKNIQHNIVIVTLLIALGVPYFASAQESKVKIYGNVYGGGEMAKVDGNTQVTVNGGSFGADIFGGGEGKLNNDGTVSMSADVTGATHVTINGGEFAVEYEDGNFAEHYNIYGGGNIASQVGETHVYVTKGMVSNSSDGSDSFLDNDRFERGEAGMAQAYYHEGQMYFCIFGGGYGKNTSVTGNTWLDFHIGDGDGIIDIRETAIEDDLLEYQSYLDVIGGGFNGIIGGNTHVHVGGNAMCRDVFGGGLYATIGTADDAEKGKTNVYITGGNVDNVYGGGVMGDIFTSTNVNIGLHENLSFDGHDYAVTNDKVTVLMSVYGGNDVSGKVPTTNIYHYGGTVDQNLFGAGNGDYTGYYTPGLCDYAEGDNDNYYPVDHSGETSTDGKGTKGPKGNTYKGRPQTGNVNITIAGNSTTDKAMVLGQVFGGGNSCTMGAWRTDLSSKYDGDPHKWRDDPEYFLGGGNLNITIGSHIKIGRTHAELAEASDEDKEAYLAKGENVSGLYMGCSGRHLATETNEETSNSYHHYYDAYTAKYWPGFAVFKDNGDPMNREEGLASFNAYMNNILIWSDNVNLNIANDVQDVWLSNFVGGGFRGSMKAKTAAGQFHYSLPRGVTIGHAIVGGAYNTDVVYRVFDTENDMHTYKEVDGHFVYRTTLKQGWVEGTDYHHVERDEEGNITGIVRFYYDGGILKSGDSDHRQQVILNAYNGGNSDLLEFAATAANEENEHALRYHKDKAILYLDLRCQLEPELIGGHVHGGNVFGGCFESGMVDGDLWTDYRCYIAPHWYGNENFNGGEKMFANAADYQNNFAMMLFGAGYGKNTTVRGDTYTRALYNRESGTATYPCLYNIFGGSFQGTVDGNTNIYYNVGQQGLCVGGLYGGGSQGYLSGKAFVELAGGYIANVYGGACEANIGKGVHVWAYDGVLRNWGDDLPEHDDAPLVIERVFGGSDVSGLIGFTADATDINDESKRIKTEDAGREAPYTAVGWPEVVFNNYDPENPEHVSILENYNPTSYNEETGALKFRKFDSYVQIGGDTRGDRGYPLVGQIYAGGNGEKTDTEHGHILPGINTALIELNDGNIMEAFGGGNMATVHEQNYIHTNGQHAPVSTITMPNALLSGILKNRVLKNVQDCYTLSGNTFTFKPNNVQRLFGGNNVAEMDIQPQWNLKAGHLGKVYAGGNMGNMTYYNPSGEAAVAGKLNPNPKGLSIHVESDSIEIDELYGGCRMANVVAKDGDGQAVEMGDDYYGATVNICGGLIHNVYGGNDVAGHVYNGSNVNITGAINGDVYGSGNGNYVYHYDTSKDAPKTGEFVEREHKDGYPYYAFRGTNSKATDVEKIQAINAIRPNVDKAYLNIAGRPDTLAYVTGAVYCGGNASTISGVNAYTKFDIGSNCVLNGVYMGSNGEQMTVTENIDHLRDVNSLKLDAAASLKEYMSAVAMDAVPRDFSIADTITEAYIGTFCLGGNCGSMITDTTLHITIPSSVTIYNKVVGGCNNAYLSYNGYSTTGGFTTWNTDKTKPKIVLDIYAKFLPRVMYVPEFQDANYPSETREAFNTRFNQYKAQKFLYVPLASVTSPTARKLSGKYCNVYGGCYTRGNVYGDVEINMYSDMLGDFLQDDTAAMLYTAKNAKRQCSADEKMSYLTNTIKYNETSARPVFSIFGGGYGSSTVIYGNTHIRLLNNNNGLGGAEAGSEAVKHPSANAIYGGGEAGKMIGTSLIHIADGTVYSNVVGGALAGNIYGNTEILVGYPGYWEVQKTGNYKLKRSNFTADELSKLDGSQTPKSAVKQSIYLIKGDRINAAVYQAINDYGDAKQTAALARVENKVSKNWNDIKIDIKGGIYGGGYSRANVDDGQTAMATTVLNFTSSYNLSTSHPEYWTEDATLDGTAIKKAGEYVYGGNSTIWVQDEINAQNWVNDGKEHITISTETDSEAHTGTGGIFGDGHSSLVAAFRSAAVDGYGYAEHPADEPKLLNTFQRFDILQIRDCAMKMYGQIDVATGQNDPTLYSVSRITELMLNSHIDADNNALRKTSELNSRNVINFYNPVHFLGSITSEVTFKPLAEGGSKYHRIDGTVVNDSSYYDYKTFKVSQNYDYENLGIHAGVGCKDEFGKRNAGTAKNMIRIDDPEGRGMHLKVVQENNYVMNVHGVKEEQSFYGPLSGVFEFALTHVQARGGGYVYSNNLHQQSISQSAAQYPGSNSASESFLQTSGNVFFVPVQIEGKDEVRYVFDDCHPIPFSDRGDGQLEKAHYWFVEGDGPAWCSYPNQPEDVDQENKIITIKTGEELAWVYDYIDHCYDSGKASPSDKDVYPAGFEGWTIQLGNDINLEQLTIVDQREMRMIWCPIADQKGTYFKGTFDGKGHKIDGMLLDVDFITTNNNYGTTSIKGNTYAANYDKYFGLFAKTKNATIKNVELSAALVRNSGGNDNEMVHIGTLITQVDGTTVTDCSVELTDSVTTDRVHEVEAVAAFICHTDGDASTIHRNFVSGTIEANAPQVTAPISGFISRLDNGSTMEHCYSLVDVHAQQVAGLADTVQGGAALEHSYYAGTLTRTDANTNWGAIVANASNANIKHCYYDITKNPVAKGYRGGDTQVFKQDGGYTNWSTYGLTTQEMTSAASGDVWRSCYDHHHTSDGETHPCEIDGDSQELQAYITAWNKGVWTYLPGFYPFLKAQELDCSALTTAFAIPTAASLGVSTRTDLPDAQQWFYVDKHFQLPAYGKMTWTVANNTLLLDSVSNKAQNKVDAHLYLGGPDVLSINCDDYHRQMQDIYITREEINSPADTTWYAGLNSSARVSLGEQLHTDSLVPGMLRHKEVTNVSKKNGEGVYLENGFDGDLHVWNRDGDVGTVTNPRRYQVNGTITYYTGYTNPYIWQEVNIPYAVANTKVHRTKTGNEYIIAARTSDLAEDADGGNFWLRSFADGADIMYGGSTFQQGWIDPAVGENIGHRPSVLRFPRVMKVNGQKYQAGDYWCYAEANNIDGTEYNNGGSELRFYSTPGNLVYGTRDWEGHADHRGIDDGYNFHVYGNPTLGNIQLEGYYWILESDKRDTAGISDPNVVPEFGTDVAQWFSLQQDPVIQPLGIWIDGPESFRQQALDEGSDAPLRLTPLYEPGVSEQFGGDEASFTASGCNEVLGVFSYIDQEISVYDVTGHLMFTAPVRANTGFTLQLPSALYVVCGSESNKQVKVLL